MQHSTLLRNEAISAIGDKQATATQKLQSMPWWKQFAKGLLSEFNAPFESDWEKKSGLHWKEWGKL